MNKEDEELRILHLEDNVCDSELAMRAIKKDGLKAEFLRVDTEQTFKQALQDFSPHLVVCDFRLPTYNGRDALIYTVENYPDLPVIILTGTLGDESAVELLRLGALDYTLKGLISFLPIAIKRALRLAQESHERKRAEDSLKLFRAVLDQSADSIEIIDPVTMNFVDINKGAHTELGYTREELLSMNVADIDPEFKADPERFIEPMKMHGHARFLTTHQRKDGSTFPVEVTMTYAQLDKQYGLSIARNISERAESEKLLLESKEQYKRLVEHMPALVYSFSLKKGGVYYSPNVAKTLGYSMSKLYSDPLLWNNSIHPDDREMVRKTIENFVKGKGFEIEYRIKDMKGNWHWLLDRSIDRRENKDGDIIIDGIAVDLTAHKLAEQKIADYTKQLESAIYGTLGAVSKMVEIRDPYTAGHERRVGIIASDIAREMGWSEKKCKDMEMIGLVHDIGKIGMPAEVLSKPARLTEIEYELIKTHPEKGFEILKDIDFAIPIAEAILQHHEHIDGSGYPKGLKGDQILPEARVLAVADVVESMASHRPYRPALGIEVALDELTSNRGTFYDPDVVDALLRLVQEKNYKLPCPLSQ